MDLCHPERRYFSEKELEHIETFLKNEPKPNTIYVKGEEKRHLLRVYLPKGCTSKETRYLDKVDPDRSDLRYYHTPRASRQERDALVSYRDLVSGKVSDVSSVDWLKWCVDVTTGAAPEAPVTIVPTSIIKARKDMEDASRIAQLEATMEKDKEKEGPTYKPLNRRK